MRLLEKTLPPFTLRLFAGFVNGKRPVSTGFLPFIWVFHPLFWILAHFSHLRSLRTLGRRGLRAVLDLGNSALNVA